MAKKKTVHEDVEEAEPDSGAGAYIVNEGSRVKHGGSLHGAGDMLDLSAEEAAPLIKAGAVTKEK
jgi:hypothetical protein